MIKPKLNSHRKWMLALIFFGPGIAAWAPYLSRGHDKLWLALLLHFGAFSLASLLYFFTWRSDDTVTAIIAQIRKQPAWNVWLTVNGKREMLGVVRGSEEGAFRFGKEKLMNRCWESELGVVAGHLDVEGPLP